MANRCERSGRAWSGALDHCDRERLGIVLHATDYYAPTICERCRLQFERTLRDASYIDGCAVFFSSFIIIVSAITVRKYKPCSLDAMALPDWRAVSP